MIRSKARLTLRPGKPLSILPLLCAVSVWLGLASCITETERIFDDCMICGSSLMTYFFLQLSRCPLPRVPLSDWEVNFTAAQFFPLNDLWRLPPYRMKATSSKNSQRRQFSAPSRIEAAPKSQCLDRTRRLILLPVTPSHFGGPPSLVLRLGGIIITRMSRIPSPFG